MNHLRLPAVLPFLLRHLSTTAPKPTQTPGPTRTSLQSQLQSSLQTLTPGFTRADVARILQSQTDPDLALDIFRWTSSPLHRNSHYRQNHLTYFTILQITIQHKRHAAALTLIDEILAGACDPHAPLYNAIIKFLISSRKSTFNRAFDVYQKMYSSENTKPSLETYSVLLSGLLRKFDKLNVSYSYLHAVRSLNRQMKAIGVIPDTFVMNMVIKAYSTCREVDEAFRVFKEMGLYNCEPNEYTYSYLVKGFCEKGYVGRGFELYREMRGKGLVMKKAACMVMVCALSMETRFDEAIEVVWDMLGNSISPDLLTYRTVLEEMCKDGKGNDALELLEGFRKKDGFMNEKSYNALLNVLHFRNRDDV